MCVESMVGCFVVDVIVFVDCDECVVVIEKLCCIGVFFVIVKCFLCLDGSLVWVCNIVLIMVDGVDYEGC